MGKPAVPLRYKLITMFAAGLLACGFAPAVSLADESVAGGFTPPEYENDARSASPNSALSSDGEGTILASTLAGSAASIVSADVALDAADPVVGSFTVDGLTYAVGPDGLTLVAVDDAASDGAIAIPASVTFNDVTYPVTAIGPYAFYLSGATDVVLPASIASVDDRAFRSSDVERIEVDPANPNLTSFDGALYSADESRLLLIPEGRKGSVLLSCETEVVQASLFSHCSLVEAISVEEGGAAFSSWNGCLYSTDGTTLLRVPAGATEITVHDGCTTIAAGAMEGCAKLERINAPASVISISPHVFTSVPTVSLPAQMAVQDGASSGVALGLPDQANETADSPVEGEAETPGSAGTQLTAMVALSTTDDDLPEVDPAAVAVLLPAGADVAPWRAAGFGAANAQDSLEEVVETANGDAPSEATASDEPGLPVVSLGTAETYNGAYDFTIVNASGSTLYQTNASGTSSTQIESRVIGCGDKNHQVHVRFLDKGGSLIVQLWHSATSDNSYYRWVKPGYVLVGVKVSNGTVTDEIRATAVGTSYTGTSKITGAGRTIAPIFEKVTYKVTLNNQSATTAGTSSVNVQYGSAMPAITPPTKAGYSFMGYFASTNGGGTKYYNADGTSAHVWDKCETYPTSLSTSVTLGTLYAYWRTSCTFDAGGGTLSVYGAHSSSGTPLQSNLSIYTAIWDTSKPTAVYGGASDRCGQFTDYVTGQLRGVYANRAGYTFLGWKASTGALINSGSQVFAQGVTYTAQWGGPYTATFNAGAGATLKVVVAAVGSSPDGSKTNGQVIAQNVTSYTASWSGSNCIYSSGTVHFWVTNNGYMYQVIPVRAGYTHTGWTGTQTVNSSTGNKTITPGGTYTATWGGPYSCTFEAGGGTLSVYKVMAADPNHLAQSGLSTFTVSWDGSNRVYGGPSDRCVHYALGSGAGAAYANRAGYTFAGWKVDGASVLTGSDVLKPGATYTAQWGAPYTCTINANGGTLSVYDVMAADPGHLTQSGLSGYTVSWDGTNRIYGGRNDGTVHFARGSTGYGVYSSRPGYSFTGWTGTVPINATTGSKMLTPGVIYTASWEANKYAVSFNANGGSGGQSAGVTATYDSAMPAISATKPIRDGYTFMGWYDNADYTKGKQYYNSAGASVRSYDKTGAATLYAGWSQYPSAHFDANGGTFRVYISQVNSSNDDGSYKGGQVVASGVANYDLDYTGARLIYPAPGRVDSWRGAYCWTLEASKAGHTLVGWKEQGGLTLNSSSSAYTFQDKQSFTAQWKANTYKVTYDANGATSGSVPAAFSIDFGSSKGLAAPTNLVKVGYTFKGWSESKTTTVPTWQPTGSYKHDAARDVILYAVWGGPYSCTFDAGGGTLSTAKEGTQPAALKDSDMLQTGLSTYTATFDSGGRVYGLSWQRCGHFTPSSSTDQTRGVYAYRDGYTFLGWQYGSRLITSESEVLAPGATYVATWEANRYLIGLDANGKAAEIDPSTVSANFDQDAELPIPLCAGYAFLGWDSEQDGSGTRYAASDEGKIVVHNLTDKPDGQVTLYAQWAPIVAAAVPIEVTARVDLLGLKEQEAVLDDEGYQGYIESRSGEPLEVAEVSFEPLSGAGELFGADVSRVSLQALAEGSVSADYAFALDAAAALKAANGAAEAAALAPFALPDGYGTRKRVTYRFDIPDDVLAAIDPARFSDVTTPVGQVVYTVALTS